MYHLSDKVPFVNVYKLCTCFQMDLTQETLNDITDELNQAVQLANNTEDQSTENLEVIAEVFRGIANQGGVVLNDMVNV